MILDATFVGKIYLPDIGGGPIIPPQPGQPPGIWGPPGPWPTPPIAPGGPPPGIWPPAGVVTPPIFYPPGIWGPTDPRPTPPINLPPTGGGQPGVPAHPIVIPLPPDSDLKPEHPIYIPPQIWGPNDPRPTPPIVIVPPPPPDGGSKPPPPEGGWGYSPEYGWGYFPPSSDKPNPAPIPEAPHVEPH